ncbi:polyprenol phosphomannose-dependent alpha 1,6 mannosyltransferase MptB [Goodfellowiella coeruleoviolacea]|uniref:Alpha-1,6-mannosyltransferase n=1 Tax=Goodfellowiella coeruleoviolacea TaxID=334858 RepID=A0AAE3KJU9_9PSEU|nr:polyprenol phosphomannose-dependent alpha 1,6 mannosyltransferase MptB [Goodfellowiella coeruleoviolacea]MCP2169492.1 alpha-1,6-mannosyltransferase [Goodfellowiella coeruleoviolacea]
MVAGGVKGQAAGGARQHDGSGNPQDGHARDDWPDQPAPLDAAERRLLDLIRRFGTVGALLLAAGSLGTGAAPVFNPVPGVPVLGLFTRMPAVSLAIAWTGIFMVVLAWIWLGRLVRPGRPRLLSRTQLDRTLVMWAAPLIFAMPMFSRDVYSYLAQSEIAARGIDPYVVGPAPALGVDHPLTRGVPNIWRETPAPYGPLFLAVGRVISWIVGNHVMTGVLVHRLLALVGVAMIVWALPRLARRFGVQPVSALWLGAANPLVLFHMVVGVHNEALAIGLMLVGVEVALRGLPRLVPGEPVPPRQPGEFAWVALGATLITLGAMVKIPAALALGFLGVLIARRWGGRLVDLLRVALLLAVVFVGVTALVSAGTGLGIGWIGTLDVAKTVKSWMSPVTALGFLGGGLGILLGLGNHTESTIALFRLIGQGVSVLICATLLWQSFRGRIKALNGLGAGLAAVLVLGPVLQPWYVLWAALPLATAMVGPRFRVLTVAGSALIAVVLPPTGATFDGRTYVLSQSVVAGLIVVGLCLLALHRRLRPMWRRDGARPTTADHPAASGEPIASDQPPAPDQPATAKAAD